MSKIPCSLIEDIMPLFLESLISEDTSNIVHEHIGHCSECQKVYEMHKESIQNPISPNKEEIDRIGSKIVHKIKRNRDREKYIIIVFSMFLSIGMTYYASGFISTIPLVLIISFGLMALYKDGVSVFLAALISSIIIGITQPYLVIFVLPVVLINTSAGILCSKLSIALKSEVFKK